MQLKVFLVVAFVTNVACLNVKEDPTSLVKILKKDPSSFVESLAGADSNTINEVINMLQVLINEGNTALQALIDSKTEAKDKLDAATTDLSNAISTQTTAEEALHEATTTKSNADAAYVDAVDKQQTADSEHTTAVNNFDTEGSLLRNNNELIEQVIGMLQTLTDATKKGPIHTFNGVNANFYISTGSGSCSVSRFMEPKKDADYFCASFYGSNYHSISYEQGTYSQSGKMGWQMNKNIGCMETGWDGISDNGDNIPGTNCTTIETQVECKIWKIEIDFAGLYDIVCSITGS